jgi:hypothetical protein
LLHTQVPVLLLAGAGGSPIHAKRLVLHWPRACSCQEERADSGYPGVRSSASRRPKSTEFTRS